MEKYTMFMDQENQHSENEYTTQYYNYFQIETCFHWKVNYPRHTRFLVLEMLSIIAYASVQFSHSVLSDSLWPHESQHSRPPWPSPTPGVHSNSHPSSPWCHPAIFILCRSLIHLPPIPPNIRVFSHESTLHMRWPKYWSFSLSIIPSKEIPGLISFRMDWLDLLAVQGTLKSLLQHHSSKASILWRSAFFIIQLTSIHDHRKNHSLD